MRATILAAFLSGAAVGASPVALADDPPRQAEIHDRCHNAGWTQIPLFFVHDAVGLESGPASSRLSNRERLTLAATASATAGRYFLLTARQESNEAAGTSARRAEAVLAALLREGGVRPRDVFHRDAGTADPLTATRDSLPEDNAAYNRSVTIEVFSPSAGQACRNGVMERRLRWIQRNCAVPTPTTPAEPAVCEAVFGQFFR